MNRKELGRIKDSFSISESGIKRIIKDFRLQMDRGLSGKKSSLKMIPAYIDRPTGKETGKFIALDLGGTNFRVLELELLGNGRMRPVKVTKFALDSRYITATGKELFDYLASSIRIFLEKNGLPADKKMDMGFTFSFPVKQTGIARGRLVCWTKNFSAKGVVGKDVVGLLQAALSRKALTRMKVAALVNDTVGTLIAGSYMDQSCDIGVILGTGTNACYSEKISNIPKLKGPKRKPAHMIINIEWGNFNKLKATRYDKRLDKDSDNPGGQVLEKMVSGMYLGELCRLVLKDLAGRGSIFKARDRAAFSKKGSFKTEYLSFIEKDSSAGLLKTGGILRSLGVLRSGVKDRRAVQKICEAISTRSSSISAAAIASVVTRIDPDVTKDHTVAVDGSVYEKHPKFAGRMRFTLKNIFGRKSSRVKIVLTKDGSGRGAAIAAAVAAGSQKGPMFPIKARILF